MKLIIFLVLMVSHRVLSQTRLVVNTTCLELAKPSNQQLRLNCSNPSRYYHCLLDETFTKEFEVCTVFMWIHEGKCAYFNTYGTGNIDLRMCKNFTHLFCPTLQYKSVENTKYPICYVKKNTSKKTPTTGSFQVASELTSDRLHSTLSPFLDTTEKKSDETRTVLPILFGIIVPFLSVFLMCSICMCWKATKKDEDSRELCTELCNLLGEEGLKLTQEVMAATISGLTGKSVETLLNDLREEEESKLKEALPEEHKRIFESKEERKTSFYVLYGLHGIFLDKELCPKSGWGNPVRGKSLGIGDDIERLYRIQTISLKISKPANISVKGYTRLLDIMRKALIRLDNDVDSKEEFKAIVQKLKQTRNELVAKQRRGLPLQLPVGKGLSISLIKSTLFSLQGLTGIDRGSSSPDLKF